MNDSRINRRGFCKATALGAALVTCTPTKSIGRRGQPHFLVSYDLATGKKASRADAIFRMTRSKS